ncbi:MAG: redoxin domain-containing protein [Gaiellaceae bacterium]|jgi:peroxiredoxin
MELLRDRREEFEAAGVKPYGISRDSPFTHIAWSQALDLAGVELLSDWNAEAVRGFGIAHERRGMQEVAERSAFLIGANGTIRGAWRYEPAEVPDFDVLLQAARS